jgi:hypothetical protein
MLLYGAKVVNNCGEMKIVNKGDDLSRKIVEINSLSYKELSLFYPLKFPTATTTIIIYKHRRKKT